MPRMKKKIEALNLDLTQDVFICPFCKRAAGVYTHGKVVFKVKLFFDSSINLVKDNLLPEIEKAKMQIKPSGKCFYCSACNKNVTRNYGLYQHAMLKRGKK